MNAKTYSDIKENELLTVRNLRRVLFHIKDQDMTISELRAKLFEIEAQEEIHTKDNIVWEI